MSGAPPPVPGPSPQLPTVARLVPGAVSPTRLAALRTGAVIAPAEAAVVTLTGPGAVTAAQGLLTNDVEKPGDGAFVYGALLTPKGMIVVDAWVARLGATMSFAVAAEGRERALAIFTRSVPPRLARLADRTTELAVYRLAGPNALAVAEAAGLPVPSAPGRVLAAPAPGTSEVARATEGAPFTLQLTFPAAETEVLTARLTAAGAVPTDAATLELARVLAGWPRRAATRGSSTSPPPRRSSDPHDGAGHGRERPRRQSRHRGAPRPWGVGAGAGAPGEPRADRAARRRGRFGRRAGCRRVARGGPGGSPRPGARGRAAAAACELAGIRGGQRRRHAPRRARGAHRGGAARAHLLRRRVRRPRRLPAGVRGAHRGLFVSADP